MKRSSHDTLPLRPLKKQKLRSNEAAPASSVHSNQGMNLATPLRGGSSIGNSHWVTPSLREPHGNRNPEDAEFGFSATPRSEKCPHQDCPTKVSPIPVQKENVPNTMRPSHVSTKEKNRQQLKAILHCNGQNVTGTIKVLLNRVADGEAHGKLGICPRCRGGKLKIEDENPQQVYCSRKTLCGFQCNTHVAPRAGPWTCVSFDDDDIASKTSSSGSSSTGNAAISTLGHTAEANIAIRPRHQMPRSNAQNAMYHRHAGYSTPPPPYWNGQRGPPNPPTMQQCARIHGPYTFYYPPHMGFPHHHRQPLHPLQMGYPPMPPPPHVAEPPSIFRGPGSVPNNSGQELQNGENVARNKQQWFPLSDPAYFPDRGTPVPPRPPDEGERGTNQDHKKNPGICNHTPAEVAMATKAAKTVLETNHTDGTKHVWSKEEDALVRNAVTASQPYNFKEWSSLAPFLPGRTGKQIRDRWINHLNPHLVHTPFDPEEDLLLWNAFLKFGKSWKEISVRHFQSRRSENKLKNRWHSVLFKKFILEKVGSKEYERAIMRCKK